MLNPGQMSCRESTRLHRWCGMLIAHALEEGAAIVTRDAEMARYSVETIW
jgi:PIN domain nuclease of toxin-antitoxin system